MLINKSTNVIKKIIVYIINVKAFLIKYLYQYNFMKLQIHYNFERNSQKFFKIVHYIISGYK